MLKYIIILIMHFCPNCNNMFYIRINAEDPNTLIYYCRNCGNEDKLLSAQNICVSSTQIKKSELTFSHVINEYTKLDPTLPRINSVLCPNSKCPTNTEDKKREIIYIRYDDVSMKYIYLCSTCNEVWKINN
jgi:DNA-directed RNA polymerase subunit M/transcription elongation factor TFIIS